MNEAKSVFFDLFNPDEALNLLIRAQLMQALEAALKTRFKTQQEAAEHLGISQERVSNLYRGKIQLFTIDSLVNLLAKAGKQVEFNIKEAA